MTDATLEVLSPEECWSLLRGHGVGRVAFVVDDAPVVLPVNYRVVEMTGRTCIALRTRPGNVLDQAPIMVAFEIDDIDASRRQGWSVLVRGTLSHIDADVPTIRERFDSAPWIGADRDAWLIVEPFAISGRRLHHPEQEWAFNARAYI
jgi:nitroimidazol reductase NimA-like FMN-containing flavoprotein (pyridoxamine 5'-phosphate oxidase superfamily)